MASRVRRSIRLSLIGYALFVFVWGLNTHGKNSDVGDEPHYLAVTKSLLQDHDLDVSNNYGSGELRPGPHARIARDGHLQSIHDIGLPVLLLPVYAVAAPIADAVPLSVLQRFRMTRPLFAYSIVSLGMLACVSAAVVLLAHGLASTTTASRAAIVAAALAFSPPVMSHSALLFPEGIAFVVGCAVVWWISPCTHARPSADWVLAAALGCLPWCHRKFSLFVIACVISMIGLRREYFRSWPAARLVGVAALVVLPHAAFYWWTFRTWGNIGGPQIVDSLPFAFGGLARGLAGLLLDRQSGLVAYAPIYLAVVAWWFLVSQRTRWLLLPVLSLLLPMSAYDTWWAGFAPAARYLVPVVPFCAVAAAECLRFTPVRRAFIALAITEIPVILYAWQHPSVLWPDGEGNPLLPHLGPVGRAYNAFLPSVHYGDLRSATSAVVVVLIANAFLIAASRRTAEPPAVLSQI